MTRKIARKIYPVRYRRLFNGIAGVLAIFTLVFFNTSLAGAVTVEGNVTTENGGITVEVKADAGIVNVPKRITVKEYVRICADSENFCRAHITQYMRTGASNDPVEVSKLQSFLVEQEGFANVQVNGVFDDATDAAVRAFQEKHSGIVLGPWAIQKGTGYVYRTTTKRINDLYCARPKL